MIMFYNNKMVRQFGVMVSLAVTLAVGGAAIMWFSVGELSAQGTADDGSSIDVEVLVAALSITTHSTTLVSANSAPTSLDMIDPDLDQAAVIAAILETPLAQVAAQKAMLAQHLDTLSGKGYDDRVSRIENLVNRLVANTEQIIRERLPLLQELIEIAQIRGEVGNFGFALIEATNANADEQYYDLMGDVFTWSYQDDVRRYSHTEWLAQNSIGLISALGAAAVLEDPSFVALAHENYTTTANRFQYSAEYLSDNYRYQVPTDLLILSDELLRIGGDDFFDALESRLRLVAAEKALLADNAATLALLAAEIDGLSAVVQGQTPPPITTLPEENPDVAGITDEAVLFGQSAAFQGPAQELGRGMRLGIWAAFNEANQAGGVHGRLLNLVNMNDGYEAQNAFSNTSRLIEDVKVFGLIGAVGTPTSRAAAPLSQEAGVPYIGPFTGANFLRDSQLHNVINYRASYYQETDLMVGRLTGDLGVTRVAVLYQNDSYGLDGLEGVRRALDRRGLELAASGFYRRNTEAVKRAASQISEARPEAVIIIGTYAPAAAAIELLREELEPDPVFLAVSFVGSEALADELGDGGAGVYVTQVTPLPDDGTSQAVTNYRAALSALDAQVEPGFVSLEGYLVGRVAIAGLQACGPDLSRSCFLDAFRNAQVVRIDDILLRYGPNDNQGSDTVLLTILGADGNYRKVDNLTRAP